MLAVERW